MLFPAVAVMFKVENDHNPILGYCYGCVEIFHLGVNVINRDLSVTGGAHHQHMENRKCNPCRINGSLRRMCPVNREIVQVIKTIRSK